MLYHWQDSFNVFGLFDSAILIQYSLRWRGTEKVCRMRESERWKEINLASNLLNAWLVAVLTRSARLWFASPIRVVWYPRAPTFPLVIMSFTPPLAHTKAKKKERKNDRETWGGKNLSKSGGWIDRRNGENNSLIKYVLCLAPCTQF